MAALRKEGEYAYGPIGEDCEFRLKISDVVIIGKWKKGSKNKEGTGFRITKNNHVWQGEFKEGKLVRGRKIDEHGTVHEGLWDGNNKKYGYGRVRGLDGYEYSGEYLEGVKHGQAKERKANGEWFSGRFERGKITGFGSLRWPDEHSFTGHWKDGKPHGRGLKEYPDGSIYDEEWEEGVVVKSVFVEKRRK